MQWQLGDREGAGSWGSRYEKVLSACVCVCVCHVIVIKIIHI